MDAILKQDIEESFRGKLWTYTPAIHQNGIGLGVAVANEPGYTPVPLSKYSADRWDDAQKKADELNAERGQDRGAITNIIASSMAQGKVGA